MTGIVYQLADNQILLIVPDVLEVTETGIFGKSRAAVGIDTAKAGIKVISPFAVNIYQEDEVREVPSVEEVDGEPTPEMKPVVTGQREVIKVILAEGGPEIGEGYTIDPATLTDTRTQLPKTKDQEIADLQARLQQAETDNLNTMLALAEVYEMIVGGA
ncbi:MAG: hypothetical protein JL50_10025 [Peptococcaceae bacterium BICA1-7]|nr:MAG: hypothetical protein JL50_10025 [Peptococcaceae bacterium BICA1-7]HBV95620.1 hypothetical protein [Desulfotomaculum sp.]